MPSSYPVFYLFPEAVKWLERKKADYSVITYNNSCTLTVENFYSDSFESFLFNKKKSAQRKDLLKKTFVYSVSIPREKLTREKLKNIVDNLDTNKWFVVEATNTRELKFLFKNQEDSHLAQLLLA